MVNYDFMVSKLMFNLIALCGFLVIFVTGVYWGYTIKENSQYINVTTKEINLVNTINKEYTYNFIPDKNKTYGAQIVPKIFNVVMIMTIIGILLLEIGYRNSVKYKNKISLHRRLKELINKIKNGVDNEKNI